MDLVFDSFKKEITEIRNHIKFIEDLKVDINSTCNSFIYSKSSSKKKYEYNSLIISLYGIVENYIELLIKSYLETLENNIIVYNSLDRQIIENHFNLSIQLISKIIEKKHIKYSQFKKEDVVLNLNNCITNSGNYQFNKDAFIINSGNLKHSKICDVFKNVVINLDTDLRTFDDFSLNTENNFIRIDELVQRRNEISHGNSSEILDNSEIIPYIDFIEKYITSIYTILKKKFENEYNHFLKEESYCLIEKYNIFSSSILGIIDGKKFDLVIGDIILVEKVSNQLFSTKIIEIKNFQHSTDITIKLDEKIKKNQKFYVCNKACC